jgi:hypothetical protein
MQCFFSCDDLNVNSLTLKKKTDSQNVLFANTCAQTRFREGWCPGYSFAYLFVLWFFGGFLLGFLLRRPVCRMLPVSLNCPYYSSPSDFSNVY